VIALTAIAGVWIKFLPAQTHWLLPAMAIALFVAGALQLQRHWTQRRWQSTKATLTSFMECEEVVDGGRGIKATYLYPRVEYQYRVRDTLYTNDAVALDKKNVWMAAHNRWGDPIDPASRPWCDWQIGSELTVFIDPLDPRRAVLIRDITPRRRSHFLALIGAGIAIALVWFAVL